MIVLIDDPAEERGQQHAAAPDKRLQLRGNPWTQHKQQRYDQQAIAAQFGIGRDDIERNVARMEGAIARFDLLPVLQAIARPRLVLDGPPVLPLHQNRRLCLDARACDLWGNLPQLGADPGHLLKDASVLTAFVWA